MKRILVFLLVCWSFMSMGTQAQATVFEWSVAAGGNGHFYEPVLTAVSWQDADDAAVARGGYLATTTSAAETDFVYGLITDPSFWVGGAKGPWLGGFQPPGSPEPGGGWTWVTGEAWAYTNWWPDGQPDNAGGNQCYLQFEGGPLHGGPFWDDQSPTYDQISYVIEYDQEPTGSCCAPAGTCTVTTEASCTDTWTQAGVCEPNTCAQPSPTETSTWGRIKAMYR